jgi:hypothetical protein
MDRRQGSTEILRMGGYRQIGDSALTLPKH